MLKRILFCLLAATWVLAEEGAPDSDAQPSSENCVCTPRMKIGYAPQTLPPAAGSFYLHDLGPGEYLAVRYELVDYTYGFCSYTTCNTQTDCRVRYNVTWDCYNPSDSGRTWILDIGGPYDAMITHTIPPGTYNPGSGAGTIDVNQCGGDDFITFNLTIDGITVHVPVNIWCEPCADYDPDSD